MFDVYCVLNADLISVGLSACLPAQCVRVCVCEGGEGGLKRGVG